jgi:hypothetical protein
LLLQLGAGFGDQIFSKPAPRGVLFLAQVTLEEKDRGWSMVCGTHVRSDGHEFLGGTRLAGFG